MSYMAYLIQTATGDTVLVWWVWFLATGFEP